MGRFNNKTVKQSVKLSVTAWSHAGPGGPTSPLHKMRRVLESVQGTRLLFNSDLSLFWWQISPATSAVHSKGTYGSEKKGPTGVVCFWGNLVWKTNQFVTNKNLPHVNVINTIFQSGAISASLTLHQRHAVHHLGRAFNWQYGHRGKPNFWNDEEKLMIFLWGEGAAEDGWTDACNSVQWSVSFYRGRSQQWHWTALKWGMSSSPLPSQPLTSHTAQYWHRASSLILTHSIFAGRILTAKSRISECRWRLSESECGQSEKPEKERQRTQRRSL